VTAPIIRMLAHVQTCRQCSTLGRDLCAEGERLREEAGESEVPMPVEGSEERRE
jgi:hypothetical protein